MSGFDQWIWITRWAEFQHYRPDPARGPAWIKDYTAQLDDERYIRLTDRQRALLRDLRDIFATLRGRLSDDATMLGRRRGLQTRRADLEALNDAGFIDFVSRETLEQRLEQLYSRVRERKRESSTKLERGNPDARRPAAAAYQPFQNQPRPARDIEVGLAAIHEILGSPEQLLDETDDE